jgi:type IV pilus assembly protein PilA
MTRCKGLRKASGFSLIELLIVVAIILIIAAIAIPNLMRAKISANEASAVASVRSVHSTQILYSQTYPDLGYADDIAKLGPPAGGGPPTPAKANLLDFVLGCPAQPCSKSGYLFAVDQTNAAIPITTFRVTAVPQVIDRTGNRGFCSSVPGIIEYDPAGGTNCTSSL